MEYRNSSGGIHIGGAIVSQIESSHGVELTGGSTGGHVRPASDDASAALHVRAKGPSGILNLCTSTGGPVNLVTGSSIAITSTLVNLNSSAVSLGGNPSSLGALRIGYDEAIQGRTSTSGVTMQIAKTSTGDLVYLGDAAYGTLVRGSSVAAESTHINLNSTRVVVGTASTRGISGIQGYTVQFTAPTMSSGIDGGSTISTVTVTGLTTGTVLLFTPTNPVNTLYNLRMHCSTVNELRMVFGHNGISTLGSGESTNRGQLLEFRF